MESQTEYATKINQGLKQFKEFLKWHTAAEDNINYERWKNWVQKMIWTYQENDEWPPEYNEFIKDNNLEKIFHQKHFIDAFTFLKKPKTKKKKFGIF